MTAPYESLSYVGFPQGIGYLHPWCLLTRFQQQFLSPLCNFPACKTVNVYAGNSPVELYSCQYLPTFLLGNLGCCRHLRFSPWWYRACLEWCVSSGTACNDWLNVRLKLFFLLLLGYSASIYIYICINHVYAYMLFYRTSGLVIVWQS